MLIFYDGNADILPESFETKNGYQAIIWNYQPAAAALDSGAWVLNLSQVNRIPSANRNSTSQYGLNF